MDLYAEVIINSDAYEIDRPFTYKVREEEENIIEVGHRVRVPFGMRNKPTEAFVIGLKCEGVEDIKRIKYISSILDDFPILTRDDLKLIEFLKEKYMCKYIDGIRAIIPTGLSKGIKNKTKTVFLINEELSETFKTKENYKKLYDFVKSNNGEYTKSEIISKGYSAYSLDKLLKSNILRKEDVVVYRYNLREYMDEEKNILNEEQRSAYKTIVNSKGKGFLLKGVTGSGKTEVYMNLVSSILREGKSAIVLVPEISLTPQMIERFKGRFGKDVALYHSKLSLGERFDEWYRVKSGEARVVVGARSAIFLPLQNLGLIIIDEEHENTYKSEQNPKYVTKEVAKFLSEIKGCKYVLGSATPSVETYYASLTKEIELVEIKNRVKNRPLPDMEVIDMREELKAKNLSLLSRQLKEDITKTLEKGEQVILFLNRRGFSTFVSCRSCGYVFKCPECDLSMTYHKNGYLICHYCGRAQKEEKKCPKCSSKYVKYFGAGTERVELEIKKNFPKARVLRMDVDTTKTKDSHERIYNAFKNGEGDILIGTQMVSKGLDFKNVTLVGVLAADISLNIPDYRSGERTFQIITQVAGRAGRGEKRGKVIIQTYTPKAVSITHSLDNNYDELYKEEIKIREAMGYPPFKEIFLINGSCKDEVKLKSYMNKLKEELVKLLKEENKDIEVYGAVPCIISRLRDNFRWQIILKGDFSIELRSKIKELLYENNKSVYNEIKISLDINPNNMT